MGGEQRGRALEDGAAALWQVPTWAEAILGRGAGASGRPAGMERTSRGIDWRAGRLEVAGRRGVNGRVPCQALQSATLAGIRGFPASARVHLHLAAEGGMG